MKPQKLHIRVYRSGVITVATLWDNDGRLEIINSWVVRSWVEVFKILDAISNSPLTYQVHVRFQGFA